MPLSLLLDPVVDLVDLGGESIELWYDELLPEGLDQQDDVSSHTSEDKMPNQRWDFSHRATKTSTD